LLAAALLVPLALRLWQLWRRHPVEFGHLNGGVFAAAMIASGVAVSSYGFVWPYLLRRLGTPAPFSWIELFFKSQLGKYLPGSVWQYAGRVGLARNRGVPVLRASVSVAAEIAYSALAAAAASTLVLGWAAGAGAIFGLLGGVVVFTVALRHHVRAFAVRVKARPGGVGLDHETARAALRAAPAAIGLYVVVWGLYGVAFWATGRALFTVPMSSLPMYVGVFALGWLAGFVAVFAPGGVGVREAVLVALLSRRLGQANAIVLAATSRIVLTAVDLVAGAASLWLPTLVERWRKR